LKSLLLACGWASACADAAVKVAWVMAWQIALILRRGPFCRRRPTIGRRPPAATSVAPLPGGLRALAEMVDRG
jgi:hypothetical protein